jgi:hypothetical protein
VHKVDGIDKLKHKVTDMLGFQRATVDANGLVKIAHRTVFQNKIDMSTCFKRMDEVDNVGMKGQAGVAVQIFGPMLDSQVI